jgi:rRNA maturation protein Nop10
MPAGKMCPECGLYTFITTPTGRQCSKCGYKMVVNPGPGKGKKCANCDKWTVFDGKCRNCGAVYISAAK